jgi:streptogramin lyase
VDTFTVDQPTAVAAAGDDVRVTSHENDSVKRIDATTGATEQTLTLTENGIPNGPTKIVIGKDGLWVASDLEHVVARIDPATNEVVDPLKLGGIAEGMAVDGDGNVWVTVHAQQA